MINKLNHILLAFLFLATLFSVPSRMDMKTRKRQDWLLDFVSLGTYFFLLPIGQFLLVENFYELVLTGWKRSLDFGWGASILLLMAVDYLWYWNHRLFHAQTPLWNLHAVHHDASQLDMFASQRNSIWSFLFMVYFWTIPLILFLAKDPIPFLVLAAIASLINFWGHTRLDFPRGSIVRKVFALAIIQPEDHFWHHSENCNFATVFNFWDKLHGTWHQPDVAPQKLGFDSGMTAWQKIFFPSSNA